MKQVYQKGCTHEFNKKRNQKNDFTAEISQRQEKLPTLKEKKQIDF